MADEGVVTRTIDEEILRYLAQVLAGLDEVRSTPLFPVNKQETLLIHLNDEYYPDAIDDVRFELRVYTNGEFHVSYIEIYAGEIRHCRWDRHDQDHNARDHFHPFPTASTTDAEDRDFPVDVTALLQTVVLPWVETRLGIIWAEQDKR
ncbi:hypothetical protein [Haladaptatus halobius]|uniref:hypothetical protein n=1 Tax=Haladaptatus halobius TaxID=2884875 RepID=UPI001D0ACEDD|nr:hypothetical protein [Haladaptatus halobius]